MNASALWAFTSARAGTAFSLTEDKTIKVWSLETFSSTKTLYGHTSSLDGHKSHVGCCVEGLDAWVWQAEVESSFESRCFLLIRLDR